MDFSTQNKKLRLAVSLPCNRTLNTYFKWDTCFLIVLLYISMSSKYTTINLLMLGLRKWFINLIKVLGEFVNPNGITIHSYNLNFILIGHLPLITQFLKFDDNHFEGQSLRIYLILITHTTCCQV